MKIASESRIEHPLEQVYAAYRDELPRIVSHLPDIREIRVESSENTSNGIKLHNRWIADREIPKMLKGIIKPEMLEWDDFAEWHDEAHYVAWTLRIPAFETQVQCSGRNSFYADGSGTRVVLTGELRIRMEQVPGVPKFMAKKLAPRVETFIVKLVTPNLKQVNESLGRYLDARD